MEKIYSYNFNRMKYVFAVGDNTDGNDIGEKCKSLYRITFTRVARERIVVLLVGTEAVKTERA